MNAFYRLAHGGERARTAGGGRNGGVPALLRRWMERRRQRRALDSLDDALLRDVGLTREDVRCETEKPFWRG